MPNINLRDQIINEKLYNFTKFEHHLSDAYGVN